MRRMFSKNQIEEIADSEVKSLVEGGTLENAKPIYYHPIVVRNSSGENRGYVSFLILNNSTEELNTASKLKTAISNFSRIAPLSGAIWNNTEEKILVVGYAFKSGNAFYCLGLYSDGTPEDSSSVSLTTFIDNAESIADGINKIN